MFMGIAPKPPLRVLPGRAHYCNTVHDMVPTPGIAPGPPRLEFGMLNYNRRGFFLRSSIMN